MTIEATLERIAAALEKIADATPLAPPVSADSQQPAPDADKPATAKRAPRASTKPAPDAPTAPPVMSGAEAEAALNGHLNTPAAETPAPAEPAPAPAAAAPAAEPAVEDAPAPAATYADVQAAATAYSQVGNRDGVMEIFGEFGIKTLKDLKEGQYAGIIAKFNTAADALKALGA